MLDPPHPDPLDPEACYRAFSARDRRFDGRFYVAVHSTGIFCRPVCSAKTPKFENCTFHSTAGAAFEAGFRPCLRCRPEIAPGVAGWHGTASSVSKALGLIAEGALDDGGTVEALASRVGLGERHLRRLFAQHVGASPISVAQLRRVLFAKQLVAETSMPLGEVALAAGFGSVRRFNEVMARTFKRPPASLRRPYSEDGGNGVALRLPFSPPFDWQALLLVLAEQAIPGVEVVEDGLYRRTLWVEQMPGTIEVCHPESTSNHLLARIRVNSTKALAPLSARLRRLFDLDVDPNAIAIHLARDNLLAPMIAARPGLRLPGVWDPMELSIRALIAKNCTHQVTRDLMGRLVERHGILLQEGIRLPGLTHVFPPVEVLKTADLSNAGVGAMCAGVIANLAATVARDPELLQHWATFDNLIAGLEAAGIQGEVAVSIATSILGETDTFSEADSVNLSAMLGIARSPLDPAVVTRTDSWRPWRAYAALHLQAELNERQMCQQSETS